MVPPARLIATVAATICPLATYAQDASQPVWSDPYEMPGPIEAMDEIKARADAYQEEIMQGVMDGKIDLSTYTRTDPVLQDVTWPYETCNDVPSLLPPPLDGWGIVSAASWSVNPVSAERARVFYYTYDPDLSRNDPAFSSSERSVTIDITDQPAMVELTTMRLSDEMMRDLAYDEGPYGYPVEKFGLRTLIGKYTVDVSGTDDDAALAYLTEIIGCAIASGTIAEGIDPETLRDTP